MTSAPKSDTTEQDVQTVAEIHSRAEQAVGRPQRLVESVTTTLGRPLIIAVILAGVTMWIVFNLMWCVACHRHPIDPPPFVWLQGVVGLMALLLTTAVLITQNRLGKMAERRALLDLQVNLLVEQKVAKLIALVEELRRDLPSVHNRSDSMAEAMTHPIDPHAMIANLDAQVQHNLERKVEEELATATDPPTPPDPT